MTDPQSTDITPEGDNEEQYRVMKLPGMFENWFLDYASYVILERAVPMLDDGLKPVQRRLLHAMKELDDGRYNKVANLIGHTMKYHPHGDASIGDALVQLGQKDLLIDMQGNWGNILTGDSAAAPRYIEARLSKFALEVAFNPKTTNWKASYDGRNKEPIALPVKFPLLLAQGGEGIAVGLSSKILPHNFNELLQASIAVLKNEPFEIYPDFPTGGMMDAERYSDGLRGGRVRIRAKISAVDKRTLVITEIPFSTTTGSLIDSIISANEKGKIKIRKIEDNTADKVEIVVHLISGTSPDQTIDALYAFTSCEVAISPNACVIENNRPIFTGVSELLKISTERTKALLELELQIQLKELEEQWHFSSLEKIFIEKRIYRDIEECVTWESVIETIDKGLEPYKKLFFREITKEDIVRLTEIKIKRISKFDSLKADEAIKNIEEGIEEVKHHLAHLTEYAIAWFEKLLKKYGAGKERLTEIRNFENIEATSVAVANAKLYVDREEGFAGIGLRKAEFVCDCSDIDDIIVFRRDGTCVITKVVDKVFIGKDIIHIDVFKRNDERTIYNMVYRDGNSGSNYVKRFAITGVTRDREYILTKGTKGTKVLYFTANPNGEAEVIKVFLRPKARLRRLNFEYDFKDLAIRGRGSIGNIISKYSIKTIVKKEEGVSTLGAVDVWYDDTVRRLNHDQRGVCLGDFHQDDKILGLYSNGEYRMYSYDLSTHFDDDLIHLRKFEEDEICNVVYFEADKGFPYLKRFSFELTERRQSFIGGEGAELFSWSFGEGLTLWVIYDNDPSSRGKQEEEIKAEEFVAVKGLNAKGKRISKYALQTAKWIEPKQEKAETKGGEEESKTLQDIFELVDVDKVSIDEIGADGKSEGAKKQDYKALDSKGPNENNTTKRVPKEALKDKEAENKEPADVPQKGKTKRGRPKKSKQNDITSVSMNKEQGIQMELDLD